MVVVGAGITGTFAALHYQRRHPRHRVLLLERGPHPSGASVRNAGFACFGSPSEVLADIDDEGADTAVARVAERWQGLQDLRQELGDAHIGYTPCGGYEVFHAGDPLYNRVAHRFDELNEALRPVFGGPVYAWRDAALADLGMKAGHLAFTPLEGSVDSGVMMRSLHARAAGAGVVVRTGSPVRALHMQEHPVRAVMEKGGTILAHRMIVATNGYLRELLPSLDVLPARGQVLVTAPIPGLRLRGTFHATEGYHYFRELNGRVLLGGGRHLDKAGETTTADGTTPLIQQDLERLLREVILPGRSFTVELRWSGVMGFRSHGKSPLIERIAPHAVVAAGLSGMGVAIGTRVARTAVDLLDG